MSTSTYSTQDLDKKDPYQSALKSLLSERSNNFALYFDHEQAISALDLTRNDLSQWLQDHESKNGARWIHFWADQSQTLLIQDLASKYDISPRLVGLLCPQKSVAQPASTQQNAKQTANGHVSVAPIAHQPSNDTESAPGGIPMVDQPSSTSLRKNITFGDIVNDLWHFHSVDWGQNYVHIGVNVLSVIPGLDQKADKPAGIRLWYSIILCHDGTVISTLERPSSFDKPEIAKIANKTIKRHILNVFSQMSRLAPTHSSNSLMSTRVRPEPRHSDITVEAAFAQRIESASLLFYYLFDDWMSTYALIARREHPYRDNLEQVRKDLTKAPNVHVLETLHNIGRQLVVLRLMYQSYATVVTRLLIRYRRLPSTAAQAWAQGSDDSQNNMPNMLGLSTQRNLTPSPQRPNLPFTNSTDLLSSSTTLDNNPTITESALFRFERLLDRIHLYALSEINECVVEKESLSLMTFNLLALSESRTVEKLTRTTILLAKATILFLPVSLMTAYFSIQIGNIQDIYSLKTYWLTFLVIIVLSMIFLYGFGTATGTVEGELVYRSLHRALWQKGVARLMRGKTKVG